MKLEKIINMVFAFGAAIVIFGAWQKITHKSMADLCLTIGLLTEVILFAIMGIQELFKKSEPTAINANNVSEANHSELTASINQLDSTIKKVFNR